MKKSRQVFGAAIAAGALVWAGSVSSHQGANGVVKQRMDRMGEIADHMKAVAGIVSAKSAFDADRVRDAARVIRSHAGHLLDEFPEGSNPAPSEASDKIWQDWDGFAALMKSMKRRAGALQGAAGSARTADDVAQQFGALAQTCKSCHSRYRD